MTGTTVGQTVRMKWDPDWDKEVLASGDAQRAVKAASDAGAAAARRFAPVLSGDYRDSIDSIVAKVSGVWHGAVSASDFKALWIERGANSPARTTPAQHVLQRGVESTGIKVGPGTGIGT